MTVEPPRPTEQRPWGTMAVICGVAPLPLAVLSVVPFGGCLSGPMTLLAIPCAIGFGIAGLWSARAEGKPLDVQALTGLVLGLVWLLLLAVGLTWMVREGLFENLKMLRSH